MIHEFDPSQCSVVFAKDFLAHFPGRGRPVRLPHLDLALYGISDCLCCGDESQAVAPLFDNGSLPFVFAESGPYTANEPGLVGIIAQALASGAETVEVEEAVPFFSPGALNLWHFTCESLPKLLALESIGYTGKYIVPRVTGGPEDTVIAESLALFGIGPERLLRSGPVYRIRRAMLPQRLSGFSLAENMPLIAFVREKLLTAVGGPLPGSKRLYVRRIGRRKPLNEADLLEVLADFDFEIMVPEDISLADEWRQMTNVECSIMAHGANTALCLLQKPHSGLIELFGNRYVSYTNLHAVRLLKLRYHSLTEELDLAAYHGERAPVCDFLRQGFGQDFWVDALHVRILLENML